MLDWIIKEYETTKTYLLSKGHSLFDWLHTIAHCTYFTAVFVEGHGFYALTAGSLLIFTIAGLFYHD